LQDSYMFVGDLTRLRVDSSDDSSWS